MTTGNCNSCVCVYVSCVDNSVHVCQAYLVNTVGESAAMGAAGVIIWDSFLTTKTQVFTNLFVY